MLFARWRHFLKINSKKLRHDVQNEETVICAKFCKDLFNISKVIGRKTKWPGFLGLPGILSTNPTLDTLVATSAESWQQMSNTIV